MSYIILGLTVGQDASATVLIDGQIAAHILRERQSGIRHHYRIDRVCIERCLTDAGIQPGDIDAVALTATQLLPGPIEDEDYFGFHQTGPQAHPRLGGEDPNIFGPPLAELPLVTRGSDPGALVY